MKKYLSLVLVLIMAVSVFTGCSTQTSKEGSFPSGTVELIAPASPGGGWDSTARAIQKVISDNDLAPGVNIIVTNKPGGKGSVGWNHIKSKDGDGHFAAMNSSLIFLNELTGRADQTYQQFTPLATFTNEWIATAVKSDSDIKTPEDLIAKLKNDPKSVRIGVAPGLGNDDHLSIVAIAKKAGVDPSELNFVVYKTSELVPGLLGGFVDIIQTGFGEVSEYYKAGDVNILATSGDVRYEGEFAKIPTWKESGIDVVFPHWRGLMGVPNMTEEQIKWWDDLLHKVVETEDWKKICKNNGWDRYYKNSSETLELYKKDYEVYKELIKELGLADLNKGK